MKILSFVIWLIVCNFWAFLDAHRNNGQKKIIIAHLPAWIIRYMIAFSLILWVFYQGNVPAPEASNIWQEIWFNREVWGVFFLKGASAWIFFDMTYNLFRVGIDWDYVGSTAWTDRFFRTFKDPFLMQLIAKGLLLIAGLILYFK
jgi:hypothetical protein